MPSAQAKIFVTQKLTRDLFAVANVLVPYTNMKQFLQLCRDFRTCVLRIWTVRLETEFHALSLQWRTPSPTTATVD